MGDGQIHLRFNLVRYSIGQHQKMFQTTTRLRRMPRFIAPRDVKSSEGHDLFITEADSEEEAINNFKAGKCEIHESHVEVIDYHEWDFQAMHEED